jgi:iron complex outermembrane receptor protein
MVGFPLYDTARAEALRGPQGTLFGRNSTGGLLQFVTTGPSDEYKGYLDASYATYDLVRLEGAVGGPIAQGLTFRVAGLYTKGDGMFKNLNARGQDSFETNTYGIRAKISAELGPDWRATITGSYNQTPRHREGVYKASPVFPDANGVTQYLPADVDYYGTGPGNDLFGYRDTSSDKWSGSFNADQGFLKKSFNYANLKLEGSIGSVDVASITNYSVGKIDYSEDTDSTPLVINIFGNGGRTRQVSEELRFSGRNDRWNWTAGLYFLDLNGRYYIDLDLPVYDIHTYNRYTQRTRSYAVFGQVEYSFTDELKLTVGGRYTYDRKTFDSKVYNLLLAGNPVIYDFSKGNPLVGDLARMTHDDWTGKVQLDYEPSNNLLLYAGVSRGYRGGGFNASPDGSIALDSTPFRHETVVDYEAGLKTKFFDGRVSLRAGGFYYDYKDYQAFNFQSTVGYVANNPAYYYGGELELTATPVHSLNISLGTSIVRGKIKDFVTPTGDVIDAKPLKAPRLSFNGLISKDFDIGDDYQLTLQYDFNYLSKSHANLLPSPVTDLPRSFMQNARVTFSLKDMGLEVYGFVRNIGNIDRKTFGYDVSFIGSALASYAPPRTFGGGIRKTF